MHFKTKSPLLFFKVRTVPQQYHVMDFSELEKSEYNVVKPLIDQNLATVTSATVLSPVDAN